MESLSDPNAGQHNGVPLGGAGGPEGPEEAASGGADETARGVFNATQNPGTGGTGDTAEADDTADVTRRPDGEAHDPLERAVLELERHVARAGWDAPVRIFALVRTAAALARDPDLEDQLPPDLVVSARVDPEHITSVEQEDLPDAPTIEELLAQIGWGPAVDGAAIVCERVVVPPDVEAEMPDDADDAVEYLMNHPAREDVRLAVGVLRDGSSCCAIRTRSHDDDGAVGTGHDLAPGVAAALLATLEG